MADTGRTAPPIHYMSRDHAIAHELTNHILHPSPAPGLRSPGAPRKVLPHAVLNSPSVTDGHQWQLAQDGLDRHDVEYGELPFHNLVSYKLFYLCTILRKNSLYTQ